jgi:hypothetical protein
VQTCGASDHGNLTMNFTRLCREVFLLAQSPVRGDGPARGRAWELRVTNYLTRRGAPSAGLSGGYQVFGHVPLSGLSHQVDETIGCQDALVLAEWKAHRSDVPKNELLRFKAVTDDYYLGLERHVPRRPILRVFGGAARVTRAVTLYCALHGIVLIEPGRWPAPVLAASDLPWPDALGQGPTLRDRKLLESLYHPMQTALMPLQDGGYRIPPPPCRSVLEAALQAQTYWSDRLWEAMDSTPGKIEAMVARVTEGEAAA